MLNLKNDTKMKRESVKGIFHKNDNTYTYDHLINTDIPSSKDLAFLMPILYEDRRNLFELGIKCVIKRGDTVPYIQIVKKAG